MTGWNRLFVVVAVCWALVAPFLVMMDANRPVEKVFDFCLRAANPSDKAEKDKCSAAFSRDFVDVQKLAAAMIGVGDGTLGLVVWGFILVPLGVLWVAGWAIGKTVRWVVAGFRR
jgi:hypothetical protein